jgi:NADPH-dependent 2,4-dienoyl-CoA reductase/sulfur reductase-like enzyme
MLKRRDFIRLLGGAGAGLSAAGWTTLAAADSKTRSRVTTTAATVPTNIGVNGRVVVIGGGMAGATVAKYLRMWGGTGVDVTLIERESAYTSSIMSNLVLNGQRTIQSLQYGYGTLANRYGIHMEHGDVVNIDPDGRKVTLANGTVLPYDRLVVAPGIDFDIVPGLKSDAAQARVPHAWKAGQQTTDLRNMITAMPNTGGVFVMSIPKAPYRCPPGPYERACVVADWLNRNKKGSKVIVLDANAGITAEPHAFTEGFFLHGIDYMPNATISSVDAGTMSIYTSAGNVIGANVINVIPPHKAGKVIIDNGLADVRDAVGVPRWAGVDVRSYEAHAAANIHVIGDASYTTQPKAGHIANQEAKVCADAIVRLFGSKQPDQSPVTNSSCYSPITQDTASWLTNVFAYDALAKDPITGRLGMMKSTTLGNVEAAGRSQDNYQDMIKWFNTLMADSFA